MILSQLVYFHSKENIRQTDKDNVAYATIPQNR